MKKVNKKLIWVIILSITLLALILSVIFSKPKKYEVVILDSLGYFSEYWEDISVVKVSDSIVSMNNGLITYKLKPGEKVELNDYTY